MNMGRSQGVAVPRGQLRGTERGEPNRIRNLAPATLLAVEYTDGQGNIIKEFWYQVGDQVYQPPNAEQFAGQLKPVKEMYASQVRTRMLSQTATTDDLPKDDDVDIVSDETASQGESTE